MIFPVCLPGRRRPPVPAASATAGARRNRSCGSPRRSRDSRRAWCRRSCRGSACSGRGALLHRIGEPPLDRRIGERCQRVCVPHGIHALLPDLRRAGRRAGSVSHHIAESSLPPCSSANAWPSMPPIDRPMKCTRAIETRPAPRRRRRQRAHRVSPATGPLPPWPRMSMRSTRKPAASSGGTCSVHMPPSEASECVMQTTGASPDRPDHRRCCVRRTAKHGPHVMRTVPPPFARHRAVSRFPSAVPDPSPIPTAKHRTASRPCGPA